MAKKKPNTAEDLSFEEALEKVEDLIDRIEGGEIGLEQSIEAYEEGAKLLARCRGVLERVEQRIEQLSQADVQAEDGPSD